VIDLSAYAVGVAVIINVGVPREMYEPMNHCVSLIEAKDSKYKTDIDIF
jgi:hypothetical protein